MPSFDIVSKIDQHEVTNAVDQANREIQTRFDFKGTHASFELSENTITLLAPSDFQLQQMRDILHNKFAKRALDIRSIDAQKAEVSLNQAKQELLIQQGVSTELAKKIVKTIKDSKLKVQTSIQGDQVRVTGKKRDDLQAVIALLKEEKFNLPLQYENFRD